MQEGTLVGVMIFPTPWPPIKNIILFRREVGGNRVQLSSDSDGHLILSIRSEEEIARRYTFEELTIEGNGRAVFSVIWSESGASPTCACNKFAK